MGNLSGRDPGMPSAGAPKLKSRDNAAPSPSPTMVSTYSLDLKERIVHSYLQGETMRSVAETFKVSLGFVHHVVNLHRICQGTIFLLFKFLLLTSQDSHAHSLSDGNLITPLTPLYFYPLTTYTSRRTRTKTKNILDSTIIFQSCPKTTTTN